MKNNSDDLKVYPNFLYSVSKKFSKCTEKLDVIIKSLWCLWHNIQYAQI